MKRHTINDSNDLDFYQLPKFLFSDELKGLTNDAKMLYAVLKDRHSLSIKNNWIDDEGHIFMYCGRAKMCELLCVSEPTVKKAFDLLVKFNLIEELRQGQGKPNKIYLLVLDKNQKNFRSRTKEYLAQEPKNFCPNNTNINNTDNNNTEINNTYMSTDADEQVQKQSNFDYQSFLKEYHKVCVSLPTIKSLTDFRKRNIKNLVKYLNNNNLELSEFFEIVENSDFLSGRSGNWNANIDWIIKQTNYIKIIEGNYANKQNVQSTTSSNNSNHSMLMEILQEFEGGRV